MYGNDELKVQWKFFKWEDQILGLLFLDSRKPCPTLDPNTKYYVFWKTKLPTPGSHKSYKKVASMTFYWCDRNWLFLKNKKVDILDVIPSLQRFFSYHFLSHHNFNTRLSIYLFIFSLMFIEIYGGLYIVLIILT